MFVIQSGPAKELQFSHCEQRPKPNSGTYIGWNDDDDDKNIYLASACYKYTIC